MRKLFDTLYIFKNMIITEKEVKLQINPEGAHGLIKEFIQMSNLDAFAFGPPSHQKIEDLYLDDDDLTLKKNNSYLRLRGREDQHTITFRKETPTADSIEIDEVTHALSDEGLRLILEKLHESKYLKSSPLFFKPTFVKILKSSKLEEKLRITINRVLRDLYVEDVKIGRIKVDEFYYHLHNNDPYFLLEIDTYKKAFHPSIDKLLSLICEKFGRRIELVNKNKYVRGINLRYN